MIMSATPLRLPADSVDSDSSSLTDMTSNPDTVFEQDRCRLLELPAEIRTHIYEFILKLDGQITLSSRRGALFADAGAGPKLSVSLLRANRQIYDEAGQVLYGSNIFGGSGKHLTCFLDMIGSSKQHLRRIYIASMEVSPSGNLRESNRVIAKLRQAEKVRLIAFGPSVSESQTAPWLAEVCKGLAVERYKRSPGHDTRECLEIFKFLPWAVYSRKDAEAEDRRMQEYRSCFRSQIDISLHAASKAQGNKSMGHFSGKHFVWKKTL